MNTGERRSDIRQEERCYERGAVVRWDCRGDVLPWARRTLTLGRVAGDFAVRLPTRSCKALRRKWPVPSGIPMARAMPWVYSMPWVCSSEAKHLLSHGKSANTAPAKGQRGWMYTPRFTGMNNRRSTHCATREEKKRICRSLRQMKLLLTCFFACYFT